MVEYPMTFDEFTHRFSTEQECREYLYSLRFKDGFVCPKCGHAKAWPIGGVLYECASCGHQTSVIAGTIFQDTRKPLREWFTAIWWITTQKNGASAQGLQQVLGLKSYKTAWAWLHKIRTAMVVSNRRKLTGMVETDETYLGGSEKGGKRGRGSENKAIVAIAVEVQGKLVGRVRMNIMDDVTSGSLQGFIKGAIEPGATLITDAWNGYSGIETEGYSRKIINQSKAEHDEELLPHVHMIVSLLKRWLLGTHQGAVSQKHLQAYLDEFVFRFNRRKSAKHGLLFYRLLENAMKVPPTTLEDLLK
jgi:transposase-like protein/Zn ribbon nucleic-acid-binding protein